MNDNEIKMFRSQIGGFNRDDVNEYIKSTDLKHTEEIHALKASLEEAVQKAETAAEAAESAEAKALGAEEAAKILRDERNALSLSLSEQKKKLAEAEAALQEKTAASHDLSKKMDFYKTQSEAQVRVIETLRRESADTVSSLERANAERADLREKLAALEKNLAEKEAALQNALLGREEAEKAAADAEANALKPGDINDKNSIAYKLEMYDKISTQLGDILLNANRTAEETLDAAKQEAEKIRLEAEAECEQKRAVCDQAIARLKAETDAEAANLRERLSTASHETLDAVSGDLQASIDQCVGEINTCVADMQYEIKNLLIQLSGRSTEMSEKIQYVQNCVSEGIESKLSKMNAEYGIHPLTERSSNDPV